MEKQMKIEVMAKAVPNNVVAYDRNPAGQHLYIEQREEIAERLMEQGYGNVKQALTEFAEKLKLRFNDITDEYGFYLVSYNSEDIYSEIENTLKEFTDGDIS